MKAICLKLFCSPLTSYPEQGLFVQQSRRRHGTSLIRLLARIECLERSAERDVPCLGTQPGGLGSTVSRSREKRDDRRREICRTIRAVPDKLENLYHGADFLEAAGYSCEAGCRSIVCACKNPFSSLLPDVSRKTRSQSCGEYKADKQRDSYETQSPFKTATL
jgi:hypothetical protein